MTAAGAGARVVCTAGTTAAGMTAACAGARVACTAGTTVAGGTLAVGAGARVACTAGTTAGGPSAAGALPTAGAVLPWAGGQTRLEADTVGAGAGGWSGAGTAMGFCAIGCAAETGWTLLTAGGTDALDGTGWRTGGAWPIIVAGGRGVPGGGGAGRAPGEERGGHQREPPGADPGGPATGAPSTMVIISPVSSASTCMTLVPSASTQSFTTLHFCPG